MGFDNDLTVEKVKTLIRKQNGVCNNCNCDLKIEYTLKTDNNFLWIELISDKDICTLISKCYTGDVILQRVRGFECFA
jgi:hypothetical protein